ncbi:MAG TPA: tetratricopeptide repeat protein [Candidatus Dormibacteraeota bacterium]|nr:tetratricopeptide repeat protein [Candidatus Dormibacteraeota bacterium]
MTTQANPIGAAGSSAAAPPQATSPWIYRPWLDLIVGCGAWSAPLLAIAAWLTPSHTHGWAVAFYLLAIIFNYPHFMATIYRAYHTREQFEKYKFFTLHLTLLMVVTAVMLHASYRLVPWVFTLYICWSPWHYTGQNYGLMMMFTRRAGAQITSTERRWLHAAFVASYVMLLASFMTGGSNDPLILSLGLPAKITLPLRLVLAIVFAAFTFVAFKPLIQRSGTRAMAAPLTLVLTQFLWFVLPTLLELHAAYQIPQTRYSSGILAVLHSAQYLWITSYYQRREARAAGQSSWRMAGYFVTLIAGGIALFIPGPWLVSYIFHYDFTTSFLIFTALVNIHHFLLDGALWKLRDSRVASLLIDAGSATQSGAQPAPAKRAARRAPREPAPAATPTRTKKLLTSPAFQLSLVGLLFLWGGLDQLHFALGTDESNLHSLLRASQLNPYDAMLQARIASASTKAGQKDDAVAALTRAVAINPDNAGLQHAAARAMIEDGRYTEAYEHYHRMLEIFPRDSDALVNYGLLAAKLGHPEEAVDSWEKAVDVAPNQPNAHLYLAQALDQKNEHAAAARHWSAFLQLAAAHPDDPAATPAQLDSATLQLADDEARMNQKQAAMAGYLSAIALAERDKNLQLESIALAHLGDYQEKIGDSTGAAHSFQRGLSLDAKFEDPRSEAFDWFNYGQFLRRRGVDLELAYACYLRAEILLGGKGGENQQTVETARREVEMLLGKRAATVQKNLPELLTRAQNLPASAFQ